VRDQIILCWLSLKMETAKFRTNNEHLALITSGADSISDTQRIDSGLTAHKINGRALNSIAKTQFPDQVNVKPRCVHPRTTDHNQVGYRFQIEVAPHP